MAILGVAGILVAFSFGQILCRPQEGACDHVSGVSSSPSSCSSYFFCDQLGMVREKECEEGMLWNQEEQYCDWEQNVSCWKDVLWYFKTGMKLLTIIQRVTANLMDPMSERGERKLDYGPNIASLVNMRTAVIAKQESTTELYTSLTDEEGSGSMAHNFVSLEDDQKSAINQAGVRDIIGGHTPPTYTTKHTPHRSEKYDGSKRKEETTETLKLSNMFKELFLEPKEEEFSETSIQNDQMSSSSTKSSLPRIVTNWVSDSIPA